MKDFCLFLLVKERGRNWHLPDSPAGFHVDTIKEPSDGSLGDQTSPRPTRHAAVFPSLSCGLKSYTNHVNKYPELRILWFFTPDYKDAAAFVVAVQMQQGLLGCQNHVKSICTYKGRPIDINDAASSTECRKCAFEPVCAFERASVSEVRVTHTCFPVGWIWWRPQGTEQTDSSESSSEGVRYPRLHRCSCQARLATMMGSRWTESASETQNRWFCCVLNNLGSIVCPPRSVVGAIYLGFGILFRIYRGVALNIFNP